MDIFFYLEKHLPVKAVSVLKETRKRVDLKFKTMVLFGKVGPKFEVQILHKNFLITSKGQML